MGLAASIGLYRLKEQIISTPNSGPSYAHVNAALFAV
jgi:hypothetical protein